MRIDTTFKIILEDTGWQYEYIYDIKGEVCCYSLTGAAEMWIACWNSKHTNKKTTHYICSLLRALRTLSGSLMPSDVLEVIPLRGSASVVTST